ncbi:unnamed protein product [Camellia sinensis]
MFWPCFLGGKRSIYSVVADVAVVFFFFDILFLLLWVAAGMCGQCSFYLATVTDFICMCSDLVRFGCYYGCCCSGFWYVLDLVTSLSVKAASVASQWLELLHQDTKGHLAASF